MCFFCLNTCIHENKQQDMFFDYLKNCINRYSIHPHVPFLVSIRKGPICFLDEELGFGRPSTQVWAPPRLSQSLGPAYTRSIHCFQSPSMSQVVPVDRPTWFIVSCWTPFPIIASNRLTSYKAGALLVPIVDLVAYLYSLNPIVPTT